jgi:hypothetical protein
MVHDAMRCMEEKGTAPDDVWTEGIKGAAATSFLGMLFACVAASDPQYSLVLRLSKIVAGSDTVRRECIFMVTLH